ncbi:hypothetical protein [Pelagicoccus sp. SDUM812003]|uniref:hypothetical protein n=1 Tax=Pelagicoccus sp. SDUM812003 TaxID=3041267 RepID=UPI0028105E68|nr:hypothetical protein [Pelagicoccus sp. SDUM812003]MDQ8203114.1 hypothetical protein [Pelagicoccus sp. SDUM812003]
MNLSKTTGLFRNGLLLAGVSFLLSACSTLGEKEEPRFIYLDTADTLQIKFHYNEDPSLQFSMPTVADQMRDARYRDYMETITPYVAAINLPMDYRILKEHEQPERGHPVLEIFALRWEHTQMGEIEGVFHATLTSYGERNKLGVFTERETLRLGYSRDDYDQTHREVLSKCLGQIFVKLDQHFELPGENGPGSPMGEESSAFLE